MNQEKTCNNCDRGFAGPSSSLCCSCITSHGSRVHWAPLSEAKMLHAAAQTMTSRRVGGPDDKPVIAVSFEDKKPEYTGGSVSYYTVHIEDPTSGGDPYDAECNDIIEALGMNYAEGNAFKAIWRRCAARGGKSKAGYKDGLYDAEKVVFFGQRLVVQEKRVAKD